MHMGDTHIFDIYIYIYIYIINGNGLNISSYKLHPKYISKLVSGNFV